METAPAPVKRGRPRSVDIPEQRRYCEEHGMTTWRRYKNGHDKHGKQQYIWLCLEHQNEKNKLAYHEAKKRGGK